LTRQERGSTIPQPIVWHRKRGLRRDVRSPIRAPTGTSSRDLEGLDVGSHPTGREDIDLFLLHQLGFDDLTLYDGSMSEWAKDRSLPIGTG
jgi:hypothetical protein